MQYFYATLWLIVGLILIFSISKENKIFILAGGFFMVLGCWWLADAVWPEIKLFEGGWGIALKCITGAALAILTIAFVREYRRKSREAKDAEQAETAKRQDKDLENW